MAAHEGLHEPSNQLSPSTIERHRAIVSMIEELEAVDWYQQRVDASGDPALAAILRHNRNEEIEHFAMVLEHVRRNDAKFDEALRMYLFTEGDITHLEEAATKGAEQASAGPTREVSSSPLTVGSLRNRTP